MMNLFMVATVGFFVVLLQCLYYYYKVSKGLLNMQQSGYDNARFIRYIKSHYKYTFGINELLLLIGIYAMQTSVLLGLFIMSFFLYYNLRFYNISSIRFTKKLKLKLTNRVKRIIGLFIFLNCLFVLGLYQFNTDFFLMMILITYLVYPFLLLTNFLLQPVEHKIKEGFKDDARKKLQLQHELEVIGVTGSYGKTSIKNIIGSILDEYEPTLITPESYNTPMGLTITVNQYLSPFHKNFIAEMGAYYEGEIKELCDLVHPRVGVVSSIGNQHLETFKNIETIQRTKMELIEALPVDGLGILNYDNQLIRDYQIKNTVPVKYYSLENADADIYAYDIEYLDAKMRFKFKFKGEVHSVETKLMGVHNIQNILAGVLVCDYKKIEIEQIIKGINRLKPVKNRLEYKYVNPTLSIIDDAFNANTEGILESIKILGNYNKKRRVLITPGLIDLGQDTESFHQKLGSYMTEYVDDIILIGTLNSPDILTGIKTTDFDLNKVRIFDNFMEGYQYALSIDAAKVVLIANDLPDKFND